MANKMKVYHGTSKMIQKPQIMLSEIGREFGIGFYVTSNREMAVKNAKRAAGKGLIYDNPKPTLNVYELDTDKIMTDFRTIRLEGYSKQWLDFIFRCYTDIHFVHHYDVVFGNAVTAEIQDIISPYRYGKISEAEVLDRLSSMPGTEQICFSTAPALEELKYLENVQL